MRWWELHLFLFMVHYSWRNVLNSKWKKKELKNDSNRTKLALLKYFKYMKHYLFIEIFDSENYLCYNFKDSMPKYSLYLTRLSSFLSLSLSLYLFSCCFVCNGKIFSFYCIVCELFFLFCCLCSDWMTGRYIRKSITVKFSDFFPVFCFCHLVDLFPWELFFKFVLWF